MFAVFAIVLAFLIIGTAFMALLLNVEERANAKYARNHNIPW